MNERIKELAEQAGVFVGDWAGAGLYSIHNKDEVEKFAELLIRECAKVITNGGYWTDILGSRKNASPAEISQMIKDYFGVEE